MTHFIFVTGGVVSSLGKGISAAALAAILESRGLRIGLIKMDPYINVDPGTMSPFQHGEVFVTEDGAETDLDLGHYERFLNVKTNQHSNITAGKIYESVIRKERQGAYLGATVQVIPHITDAIKDWILSHESDNYDLLFVEIGGTVGDIESLPFLEAVRQLSVDLGSGRCLFMHLTLLPYLPTASELKTKPTQHSVKELRSIGIAPDILICRSSVPVSDAERQKIALFTNVSPEAVITAEDAASIYEVPMQLHAQKLDALVLRHFHIEAPPADLSTWQWVLDMKQNPKHYVRVALVAKYQFQDAYKSVFEALEHAGLQHQTKVEVHFIDAEQIESPADLAKMDLDAILIPGGFGNRGVAGKLHAIQYARESNTPYLGICLGMQLAVIEYARNCAKLANANSTEFDADCAHPVIALVSEWEDPDGTRQERSANSDLGGTMRLGLQACRLAADSKIAAAYQKNEIYERHRHRYEVNQNYVHDLEALGLHIVGHSGDKNLAEVVELKDHPWFVAVQFHPEFASSPKTGHPLFNAFIQAALAHSE